MATQNLKRKEGVLQEAHELENIFGSIYRKAEAPSKTWLQNVWNFDILI